jgi:Zn-dependent oligopeptidase
MTEDNNGSGIEADFSYLFLSPEELDKYKAEVQGRAYIPKKRYEKTIRTRNSQRDTPTLTQTQRALLATRTEHI